MLERQEVIRISRIVLTCSILFLLTWYYEVPESIWSLTTLSFVMFEFTTVGGVFTKSKLRFIGTSCSALYGIFIIYFCANNPLINMLAFIPALFVYGYFFMRGDKTYIGTIGTMTLTMILFNYNDLEIALLRLLNVVFGIVSAIFMIRFFYPQYSRDILLQTLWDATDNLSLQIELYLDETKSLDSIKNEFESMSDNMSKYTTSFNKHLIQAKIETKKTPFFILHNKTAMNQLRQLYHLISVFITYSKEEVRTAPDVVTNLSQILSYLWMIQCRLANDKITLDKNILMEVEDHLNNDRVKESKTDYLQSILAIIKKESLLLNKQIEKIEKDYQEYQVKPSYFTKLMRFKYGYES